MTAFEKKNSIETPMKHQVQKKVRSQNERNAEKATFITQQKSIKTTAYSIKNQKRSKLRSARELTVCASSQWSPRKTPKNSSEAKKRNLRYRMSQKLCKYHQSQMRRKNWIAKRGAPYPHIANGHYMFPVCIGVSAAIDKRFFTFFEGNRKQTQFHKFELK